MARSMNAKPGKNGPVSGPKIPNASPQRTATKGRVVVQKK